MSDEPLKPGDRVALRNAMEAVYPNAFAGSEGWIRETRTDEDGFEYVLVEWDRDHWRYSGEKDIWTFASHFTRIDGPQYVPDTEPVEEPSAEPEPEPEVERVQEGPVYTCPDCGLPHLTEEDIKWIEYMDTLQEAWEKAAQADNFVLITYAPREDDPTSLAPHLYMQSHSIAHSHQLFAQMANMVAAAYKSVARKEREDGRQAPPVHPDHQERPSEQE